MNRHRDGCVAGQRSVGRGLWVLLAWLGVAPPHASAHPRSALAPQDLWSAWSNEPAVLLGIGLAAWLYSRGVGRLWSRTGVGRGVRRWQFACFVGGLAVLVLALVSPLDALGSTLFAAHMAQHEVLILAAAPLLILGTPLLPFLWALPQPWRKRLGRWSKAGTVRGARRAITHPLAA